MADLTPAPDDPIVLALTAGMRAPLVDHVRSLCSPEEFIEVIRYAQTAILATRQASTSRLHGFALVCAADLFSAACQSAERVGLTQTQES